MNIVNRGYVFVKPTSEFKEWANKNNEELNLLDSTMEATCYLVEEDFWDEDVLIEKYYKKISSQEFYPITQDKQEWPLIQNEIDFKKYFQVEIGSFVYDLIKNDLKRESV